MLTEVIKKYESNKKQNSKAIETLTEQIHSQIEAQTVRALKVQNHVLLSYTLLEGDAHSFESASY